MATTTINPHLHILSITLFFLLTTTPSSSLPAATISAAPSPYQFIPISSSAPPLLSPDITPLFPSPTAGNSADSPAGGLPTIPSSPSPPNPDMPEPDSAASPDSSMAIAPTSSSAKKSLSWFCGVGYFAGYMWLLESFFV